MAKFPDLTNDGKVTQADILKGRGVYKKGGPVEGFKTKQQSMKGHYCWGDMPMKKAMGGYAEGGPKDDKYSVSERQPNILKVTPGDNYSVADVPGVGKRLQRKTLEQLLDERYDDRNPMKKAKGGNVSKPKLASDKKKYSDRDMQGIISQAKQLAPKIIQANQARNAQAQAAAGAQQPPMGGAMPARPMMPTRPPMGAMPTMKKGGKLKLRRKG